MSEPEVILHCANHPDIETSLRCSRCEKPICSRCAVRTPTGYRCQECVRNQQKVFETAEWFDYISGPVAAALLAFLGSLIVPSFGFFTIFLAPIAGTVIAEVARLLIRRRRSKQLYQIITAAVVAGALPVFLWNAIPSLVFGSRAGAGILWSLLWPAVYILMVASSAYYRLAGIKINR